MPHVSSGSSSGGGGSGMAGASTSSSSHVRDDPNDCDEVKVFKCAEDEGEGDSDDVMNDDKRDLIQATECDQKGRLSPLSPLSPAFSGGHSSSYSSSKNGHATLRPDPTSIFGKSLEGVPHPSPLNMGYLMSYPYANGSPLSTMAEKMRLSAGSLPFFCNGVEGLTQPPPAHMGYHGLSRSAMYPFGVQYPYSGLPEVSQVAASWHAQSMYPISNAGSPGGSAGFRNYPPSLSIPPTSLPSDFYRFSPGALLQGSGLPPHPGLSHHLVGNPSKHDAHSSHLDHNHRLQQEGGRRGSTVQVRRVQTEVTRTEEIVETVEAKGSEYQDFLAFYDYQGIRRASHPVTLEEFSMASNALNLKIALENAASEMQRKEEHYLGMARMRAFEKMNEERLQSVHRRMRETVYKRRGRVGDYCVDFQPENPNLDWGPGQLPPVVVQSERLEMMEEDDAQEILGNPSYMDSNKGSSNKDETGCRTFEIVFEYLPFSNACNEDSETTSDLSQSQPMPRYEDHYEMPLGVQLEVVLQHPPHPLTLKNPVRRPPTVKELLIMARKQSPKAVKPRKKYVRKKKIPALKKSKKSDQKCKKSKTFSNRSSMSDQKSSDTHGSKNASDSGQSSNSQNEKKKPHIKKPLNAFMLYMKEMRAKVVAECTLKESAAINQILGRRWHSLNREEQAKYYELARQERQVHMQMYPGWSARDNYGYGAKKKKRKKEKTSDGGREEQAKYYELARRERQLHMQMYPNWSSAQNRTHHEKKRKKKQDQKFDGGNSMKKCRARYGLDQQGQWCKPCRRKKKCIRYLEESNNGSVNNVNSPDDNLGSAGSAGEPLSPDSKAGDSDIDGKSSDMGMSSPSFSLTSPGMSMTSPGMSLPSPALTSPSGVLPSPASIASPAVSLPSLQSPMTPSLTDDRHPISSVSSSTSSVSFAAAASNHTTTSNALTSTSSSGGNGHHNHHHSSSSRSQANSSPLTSSYKHSSSNHLSHHHHQSNNLSHHHHQFGFGLGHLLGAGGGMNGPNGVMPSIPGLPGNLPFPFPLGGLKPHRNPVGANPHDINNPLSVNQLTGQCNSSSSSSSASSLSSERSSSASSQKSNSNSIMATHNNNNHHHSSSSGGHGGSGHHHHHSSSNSNNKMDRSRVRDRDRMDVDRDSDNNVSSSNKNKASEGKALPSTAPVIGVS